MIRVSLTSVAAPSDKPVGRASGGRHGAYWDGLDRGCSGFSAEVPLEKHQNKAISSLSGTVNHSWVYHRNPDSVNTSQEGKLKASPTHGSKNSIIIASFTGTGVCRAEEEICSIMFLTKEHGQGLLTLCISQWVIAWTPEHETGGSANRLRDTTRGRNQLHFLFIRSPPSIPPAPVIPGTHPPPPSSSPLPSRAGGRTPGAAEPAPGAGTPPACAGPAGARGPLSTR